MHLFEQQIFVIEATRQILRDPFMGAKLDISLYINY